MGVVGKEFPCPHGGVSDPPLAGTSRYPSNTTLFIQLRKMASVSRYDLRVQNTYKIR